MECSKKQDQINEKQVSKPKNGIVLLFVGRQGTHTKISVASKRSFFVDAPQREVDEWVGVLESLRRLKTGGMEG